MNYTTLNAFDATEKIQKHTFEDNIQEVEMIGKMSYIARTEKLETFWPNVSLVTEQILDATRRSLDKDGALVEFIKNQLWFEMTHANRRYSVTGSREHVFGSVRGINLAEFQANNNSNNNNKGNNNNSNINNHQTNSSNIIQNMITPDGSNSNTNNNSKSSRNNNYNTNQTPNSYDYNNNYRSQDDQKTDL